MPDVNFFSMNIIKSIVASLFHKFVGISFLMIIGCVAILNASSENEICFGDAFDRSDLNIITPSTKEFPVVAVVVFNSQYGPQKDVIQGVSECGFNLCMQITNAEYTRSMLDCLKDINLKFIPGDLTLITSNSDTHWQEEMRGYINEFKDNTKIAGWCLYDEPKWNQLRKLKQRYDVLRKIDDSHFVSINFVGEMQKNFTGPCHTLPAYLDSIQEIFSTSLDVWSSDCYPLWIRNGQLEVRYKVFFDNLAAFSAKSKATGIPMWTYCQSMHCDIGGHHVLPEASVPYLSFSAFSALAYGSQGIAYWTYSMKPSSPAETYLSALVDLDGNKTPAWYAAQSVNRQIRALTPVFLGATMEEVRHSGNIPLKDMRPFISNFGPIDRLTNGDKGVLVSHLSNDGKDYIVIVNHDVQEKQNIRLKFKREFSKITEIRASVSGKMIRETVSGLQKFTLPPGGYIIYQWQK